MRAYDEITFFWHHGRSSLGPPLSFDLLISSWSIAPGTNSQNREAIILADICVANLAHLQLLNMHLFARRILEPVHNRVPANFYGLLECHQGFDCNIFPIFRLVVGISKIGRFVCVIAWARAHRLILLHGVRISPKRHIFIVLLTTFKKSGYKIFSVRVTCWTYVVWGILWFIFKIVHIIILKNYLRIMFLYFRRQLGAP